MITPTRRDLYAGIANIFIPHPKFEDVLQEIREVIALAPCDDAPCLHVSGPPGIGKTTLRSRLKTEHPVVKSGRKVRLLGHQVIEADHVPLLQLRMPPQPTVKSLAREMLQALGDELWWRGDEFMVGERVDRYLEGCGTSTILIDDAQRAIDRTGVVVSEKLLDWLKERHERLGTSLVLLGLGRLRYLFEADAQIERRWDAELRLEPYTWLTLEGAQDRDGQANFHGVLGAFSELSPLPFAFDVDDPDIAFRFFYASRGVTGYVKKLLLMAMRIAAASPGAFDAVDLDLLKLAFPRAFRTELQTLANPFDVSFQPTMPPPLDDDRVLLAEKPSLENRRRRATKAAAQDRLTKAR